MTKTRIFAALLLLFGTAPAFAQGLTPEDLATLARLSTPQVSPDGSTIAFVLRETDFKANRGRTDIWLLELDRQGAEPLRLTTHEENDSDPQWSPDGSHVYFLSNRSGSSQVWRIAVEGGEATQVTDYPIDVANLLLPRNGSRIAFTASVFPDCKSLACTSDRAEEIEESAHTGILFDQLFVRHWDSWKDGRRSALFTAVLGDDGKADDEPVKISQGLTGDVPSVPFGGREEIAFAPDGNTLYFALRTADRTEPWSTNLDLFSAPTDGSAEPENLTAENAAVDTHPVVSPDGTLLAWTAMRRAGYESDQLDVMIRELATGETRNLTADWDRSVDDIAFAPQGDRLYVTAGEIGTRAIFEIDIADGSVEAVTTSLAASGLQLTNDRMIFAQESFASPADLYALPRQGGSPTRLTTVNAAALADIEMAHYEQFSFVGADDDTVHGYVLRPIGFEEGERYPIAFLIHGGPQSTFSEGWSYRWNPQTYAAQGYGVVVVDFHGSSGYGQNFTDSINLDWGGKPLVDLQRGLAAAVEQFPWLEEDNACALGASYGGYMINWIAGNWPERFRCLVNHAGLFDLRSFYFATEELWFPEWDFGGPYFENVEEYERWNPVRHVAQWRTPMLVTHGANDYRVPLEQGLGTFTALQRQGVASKLLVFPDENHWVLSPANSIQWHEVVHAWLDDHLKGEADR